MFTYSLATEGDRAEIVNFIRLHWKEDHIFVRDRDFFDFEMIAMGDLPQFALVKSDGVLVGLVGFVQYDETVAESDLFLVILRVLDEYSKHGLALKLLAYCKSLTSKEVHTVGANPKALPLYQLCGFRVGWLDHYYWINPEQSSFTIAEPGSYKSSFVSPQNPSNRISTTFPSQGDFEQVEQIHKAEKSYLFFRKRYFEHPIYTYETVSVLDPKGRHILGVGVIRIVEVGTSRMVRIVGWIGSLRNISEFLDHARRRCIELGAEYVDIYISEAEPSDICASNFVSIDETVTIPNYFQPLVKSNVKLSFATTSKTQMYFLRGDGDQDRPS